jgi:hypothetical protein
MFNNLTKKIKKQFEEQVMNGVKKKKSRKIRKHEIEFLKKYFIKNNPILANGKKKKKDNNG